MPARVCHVFFTFLEPGSSLDRFHHCKLRVTDFIERSIPHPPSSSVNSPEKVHPKEG